LKSLVVAGDIVYSGGRWDRNATSELQIPRSVQDAVKRRITQLSASRASALILAAVIGQRFDCALLQHVTGRAESDLLQLIKELITTQLVVEVSSEAFAFAMGSRGKPSAHSRQRTAADARAQGVAPGVRHTVRTGYLLALLARFTPT
jgi:hypothetical protein